MNNNFYLPTYIINLKSRPERLAHIKTEFEGRDEFKITIIDAIEDQIGAVGLWKTFSKIINMAIENDDDVILICEDDHFFTEQYSKEELFNNILEANKQGADILCGGISGGFRCAFPIGKNRMWVDGYWCNQFILIYKKFFQIILDTEFIKTNKVDQTLTALTPNKMVIFPFISKQKSFGYSDVTPYNNAHPEWAANRFETASERLEAVAEIHKYYNGLTSFNENKKQTVSNS